MRRMLFRLFLIAPLLCAGLAKAQSRDERDIRALVDRALQAVSTVDPKAAKQILAEYAPGAGPFFPPFTASLNSVADVESDLVQTLPQLSARTVTATGPVNVKVDKNSAWATLPWKADVTFKDGTRRSFSGRSTLTFARDRKNWKIAHWHHSLPAPPPLTGSALQAEADAILKMERDAWEAAKNKQMDAFADYFTEDASMFGEGQAYRVRGKADLMRGLEAWINQNDLRSYQLLDPQVQVVDNTALVTYYFSVAGTRAGKDFSESGKVSMVYVKQDGKWRVLHEHSSASR
ncbi:MAG: nuclear transport factor 2 family protein [Acidobacteria bacterium]|nr:nuclear transport factor 2 family protein [Acidobacteriota bacterium]